MKRTPLKAGKGFKQKQYTLKSNKSLVGKKKINAKSKKQKQIESDYSRIKREEFSEDALCTGCKNSNQSTPSHLIPRSRRRDLVAEIRNIKPHCITCHEKWESRERIDLLDYEENLEIVKELDEEYYQILLRDEALIRRSREL